MQAGACDPAKIPRCGVVERLHNWLNRSCRLLARWEKLACTYLAFVQLACALTSFQRCACWWRLPTESASYAP
jgi:hypothetical protein